MYLHFGNYMMTIKPIIIMRPFSHYAVPPSVQYRLS